MPFFKRASVVYLLCSLTPSLAFFKVPCSTPLVIQRADPIVQPGVASGHVHTIMGGSGFGFTMDYNMTQTSQCNSCSAVEDKSNYWISSLYYHAENGSFIPVPQNGGALIYYLQRPDPTTDGTIVAPPAGFRMVAGNPFDRRNKGNIAAQARSFACLDYDGPGTPQTHGFPTTNCPNGLRAQVFFPSCWDGVNLDSPDHRSHVAYPTQEYDSGPCPASHPVRIISIFIEVTWHTEQFADMWYGDKQPFVFSYGDPTGYGLHADFINGWDIDVLQDAINTCHDEGGDIRQCEPITLQEDWVTDGCILERSIHEQIDGWLDALPGCNPIQPGPEDAKPVTGCGAPTAIGEPLHYYTDLTSSHGWEWVGCTQDNVGGERILTGSSAGTSDMTPATCVEKCLADGYSFAGVENSNECFCGDSVGEDKMPKVTPMGKCLQPCAGDGLQNCGGYGFIGLYRKCEGECGNLQYPVVPH
ncbi:hypothetical protein AN7870.2 [Aspergillus nidulans FGSC A4]|uniref:WSC domain protein, putative (AFU_orthologue AFUA_6G11970) n=1 Tax=Emericella nidulans (strain FGSC A4 / ATCC 38163 / CBS 112.46 / NRRL 194 / M139) TaxID=227321 RepID=Q5AV10_EMENI|nr:hypothetical protein [Aspergillus nidulans FGSC A4]EAA58915.1 hypothetical protein AN7870.2 [Aspergillus nidulans FGSC A4]CBF73423.1 TPA: WSC domain protein, putative (AFU_orthologue; AFUA_6G11970) [Aspergillus nidulans FGSC A4]|eukprot:XP_681139.1 hypothetical protein AN7870.2 [Aspergillus nidulans FGSC A4]